jgi:hypothetical protein
VVAAVIFVTSHSASGDSVPDAELQASLQRAEQAAAGRGAREAYQFANLVIKAFDAESVKSGRLDLDLFIGKAVAALDVAIKYNKEEAPILLFAKGLLFKKAGQQEAAIAAMRASLAARPNLYPLVQLFQLTEEHLSGAEVKKMCKRVRPYVDSDQERFDLLEASMRYGHAVTVEGGLSWAPANERAWYKAQLAERAEQRQRAKEAARRAEEDRLVAEEEKKRLAAERREAEEQQRRAREAEAAFRAEQIASQQRWVEAQQEAERQRHLDLALEQSVCAIKRGLWEQGRCVVTPPPSYQPSEEQQTQPRQRQPRQHQFCVFDGFGNERGCYSTRDLCLTMRSTVMNGTCAIK